jgi:hypothetical protein
MPTYPINTNPGALLETTTVFEFGDKEAENPAKVRQVINKIANILNLKDTGLYSLDEFLTSKIYPPQPATNKLPGTENTQRPAFRKFFIAVYPVGLPNITVTIAHNLNINSPGDSIWTMTNIYGTANDITYIPLPLILTMQYYPLPYIDPAGANICLWVDSDNINIRSIIARPTVTIVYVCLEYLKF